jgi:hypothetical protein
MAINKFKKNSTAFYFVLFISGLAMILSASSYMLRHDTGLEIKDSPLLPVSPGGDSEFRDLYSDTWVGSDALGRLMPLFDEVGPLKKDQRRVVGMFYITWHTQNLLKLEQPYRANVSYILQTDPAARLDAKHPLWYTKSYYHWAEPEMGYFLSQDEFVIRKDMSMLADAGVDVLIMDVTNAVRYWDEWEVTFRVMQEMKAQGNQVPDFCFWAFNGPSITVVQELYERIYKQEKYKDLWFHWDGKPLLLYNGRPDLDANRKEIRHPNPNFDPATKSDPNHPHYQDPDYAEAFYLNYTREVREFFTLRTMWWGYYEWGGERFVGTEDNWSFGYSLADPRVKAMKPEELLSTHRGRREQGAVTAAQHPVSMSGINMGVGKSWSRANGQPPLNEYDMPAPAYVPWLGKTVENPEAYGIYFQERWDEMIEADPEFLYLNDWNEWTAGKFHPREGETFPWLGRNSNFYFVDQYNAEFNRCIHPMKGGYTDNYYMQMAQNIRRYKGARPIPVHRGFQPVKINGQFSDWKNVIAEYRDTRGDTFHRNALGYASIRYVDETGRNDIITSKVSVDEKNIYFYAETADNLTHHSGNNWMLLLIDADNNPETGWYGYDYLINKEINDHGTTTLMRYHENNSGDVWEIVSNLDVAYEGRELEIAVPRKLLKLNASQFTFDFKWADNPGGLIDPLSLATSGDTAPNRRFNYRFIWEE